MASRRWIRLDVGWEDSEWLDTLDGTAAGCWPRLLCWVKRDGIRGRVKRPSIEVVARRWRVPPDAVLALEAAACSGDDPAMAVIEGDWIVLKWADFQEHDATAADRMKKYRKDKSRLSPLRRNTVTTAVTGRNLSCATETETVKKEKPSASTKKWRFVPDGWMPNEGHHKLAKELGVNLTEEAAKYQDHEFATPKSDPDRTFSNWLRTAADRRGTRPVQGIARPMHETNPLYAPPLGRAVNE